MSGRYIQFSSSGAKRDIDDAPARCRSRPGEAATFAKEAPAMLPGAGSIAPTYADLLFCFTGSPGILGRIVIADEARRQTRRPSNLLLNHRRFFWGSVFVTSIEGRVSIEKQRTSVFKHNDCYWPSSETNDSSPTPPTPLLIKT